MHVPWYYHLPWFKPKLSHVRDGIGLAYYKDQNDLMWVQAIEDHFPFLKKGQYTFWFQTLEDFMADRFSQDRMVHWY